MSKKGASDGPCRMWPLRGAKIRIRKHWGRRHWPGRAPNSGPVRGALGKQRTMPRSAARSGATGVAGASPPSLPRLTFSVAPLPQPRPRRVCRRRPGRGACPAADPAEDRAEGSGPCQGAHRSAELQKSLEVDGIGEQDGGVGGGDRGT